MPTSSTLILGCGYLGQRVAQQLITAGQTVYGTTRSQAGADRLAAMAIMPVLADVTDPMSLRAFPVVDRILFCVGFDRSAGQSIRQVYVDGLSRFLAVIADRQPACPLVYASSTGVYGGSDGDWVDETSPVDPQTESGRACWEAEQILADHAGRNQCGTIVLRYAGLYGPRRIMRQASLARGEPVVGSPDKWLNFIQIDDAAAVAVRALEDAGTIGHELFLVADGHPLTRTEFYGAVAELLGAPSPRFETPAPGSPAAAREDSNKRIDNRKLLGRWSDCLRYADIRAGLTASLAAS